MQTTTISDTTARILEEINSNPTFKKLICLNQKQAAEAIGVSERSIERTMRKLQDERLLIRKGAAKGGSWEVVS